MSVFKLRHTTTYKFSAPVMLGPHLLYLRPRADHALRLDESTLTVSPPAEVIWRNDAYGNSVAVATFAGQTTQLEIVSDLTVETFPRSEDQRMALLANGPLVWPVNEQPALAPFFYIENRDRSGIAGWLKKTVSKTAKLPYDKLLECAARIRHEFDYRERYEPGLQSPQQTVAMHSGTCRDFAELMIAASRSLGCAARFVSGYIYVPNAAPGAAAPHAWAECYLPGTGWIEIDATNGLVEHGDLIPVAVAITGRNLSPVTGTFTGAASSQLSVGVDVVKLS
jgi:transglutaminase-like putative cysteine protease